MSRFYSELTGCTYLSSIHRVMPADAVPITEQRFMAVIANHYPGKVRSHDEAGLPILIDPPQLDAAALYQIRTVAINTACNHAITNGFVSVTLGAPHFYGSELDDQLNLTGVILAGLDSIYPCRDEDGVKAFRPHTAQQLRQVGDDFTAFKLVLLKKANELKQLLDQAVAANDLSAIEAINWESLP